MLISVRYKSARVCVCVCVHACLRTYVFVCMNACVCARARATESLRVWQIETGRQTNRLTDERGKANKNAGQLSITVTVNATLMNRPGSQPGKIPKQSQHSQHSTQVHRWSRISKILEQTSRYQNTPVELAAKENTAVAFSRELRWICTCYAPHVQHEAKVEAERCTCYSSFKTNQA